jgi:hypothetical protein
MNLSRLGLLLLVCASPLSAQEAKKDDKKPDAKEALKEIAGSAEFLRAIPKKFAAFKKADLKQRTVTLRLEGEGADKAWPLTPDAEIKIQGWWGRLSQLSEEEKVWVWFHVDRTKKPVAIFMLSDDWSEQDIHGGGCLVKSAAGKLVLKPHIGKEFELPMTTSLRRDGKVEFSKEPAKEGERLFVRKFPNEMVLWDAKSFEARRAAQRATLESEWWNKEGLPGTIGYVSVYTGEADILIDHEGMRWAPARPSGPW